jgi:hypothetical protein
MTGMRKSHMGRGSSNAYVGADAQQTLASVIRTAQQRHRNPHAVLASMLQSPTPLVPRELQAPAAN